MHSGILNSSSIFYLSRFSGWRSHKQLVCLETAGLMLPSERAFHVLSFSTAFVLNPNFLVSMHDSSGNLDGLRTTDNL